MSVVDEIKQRLDAVELIGSYVQLKKAGHNFKGLCPFHTEKTPSFVVFPDSQSWHCFGACSTGGDIFSFVMRHENLDFQEALKLLAERAGVELAPITDIEVEQRNTLDRLRAINAESASFFHQTMMSRPEGRIGYDYFERRGVAPETMQQFQLGYALDDWHSLENHLKRRGYQVNDLLEAGVLSKSERGNIYDRFRGRVIFPIRDVRGNVIGFGGRVLDDSVPKYLNTPQTPLFDKGSLLYGIDLARKSIRDSETAVIVEGYMDVIVPHQCGATNLVACMGTALTESHLQVLKRLSKRLVLALDPDAAGIAAVEKGVATAQRELASSVPVPTAKGLIEYEAKMDMEIAVVTLPDGLDPDELVLRDRTEWDTLIAHALPVADFFFQQVAESTNLSTAKGKKAAADRLIPVIAAISSAVERTHYVQRLATMLHVDERDLLADLGVTRGSSRSPYQHRRRSAAPPPVSPPQSGREKQSLGLEERSLALMLNAPDLVTEAIEVTTPREDMFSDERNRALFRALCDMPESDPELALTNLKESLDTSLAAHVESLLQDLAAGPPMDAKMAREDLLKSLTRLRNQHLDRLIQQYRFMQQQAQAEGQADQIRHYSQVVVALARDKASADKDYYAATMVGRKH